MGLLHLAPLCVAGIFPNDTFFHERLFAEQVYGSSSKFRFENIRDTYADTLLHQRKYFQKK